MNDELNQQAEPPRPEDEQPTPAAAPTDETQPSIAREEHRDQDDGEQSEKVETVSLLDLMEGSDDPATQTMLPAELGTDLPSPIVTSGDEVTGTQHAAPTRTERPVGLPLSPEELTPPRERPLESDEEATTVQPRVAFPGSTDERIRRPTSEAPTQVHQRPESALPSQDAPTRQRIPRPQRRPVREPDPVRVAIPEQRRQPQPRPVSRRRRSWGSCISRTIIIGIILAFATVALSIAGAAIGYSVIASDLPSPQELESRASTFETTRIYDRNGRLLYSLADPLTGNRTYVPLSQISQTLQDATIATEDQRFYENPGFDPIGIARAIVQAAREREFVSGASTITQQLVRAVLLDEEERTDRTFRRKVREIILAAEISRTYPKEKILELYLNEIYYGNLAYGIEAAAETYFSKSADDLTLAEASLLAGLPQAPALWDPYTAPDKAIGRQWEVLTLMVQSGYVSLDEAQEALNRTNLFIYNMEPPEVTIRYPHFTVTVLQQAEESFGAQAVYGGGLNIFTTIDPTTQRLAEETIGEYTEHIITAGANNAAMVVVQPQSGEILALVGSVDFNDEAISGQVNMALQPRQPGSTIKPFVYLSAMEQSWTPSTLIWDVPTQFPNGTNPPYEPKNYDDQFHGPLLLREALGNSYNVTAVKALELVGVCNFINNVQKLGLRALQDGGCAEVEQPRDYGLALSLGGGEIPPLQMATAFAILANQGQFQQPYAITRIENRQGELLFEHAPVAPESAQVVRAEHAYLLNHILSDNDARQPEFGINNNLVIPGHRVAAKTGTSGTTRFDVRDAWTIGYTSQVVTAVWVGNTNNEPLGDGASGYAVASPIWNSFMNQYLADKEQGTFARPPGIVEMEICADSGVQASAACSERKTELFAGDQLPLPEGNHFLQTIPVDLWTGRRATQACPESVYEARFVNLLVSGSENVREREERNARDWLEDTTGGQNWASRRNIGIPLRLPPQTDCDGDTPRPEVVITQPGSGSEVVDSIEIVGTAKGPGVTGFQVEYGLGQNPAGWGIVQALQNRTAENERLAWWDTTDVGENGPITLRVVIFGPDNPYTPERDPVVLDERLPLILLLPTATPTPTSTPTATPTPSATPSPTPTAPATILPTITPFPSATPSAEPTEPPPATETAEPTAYP